MPTPLVRDQSSQRRSALRYGLGAVVCWSLLAPLVVLAVRNMDAWLALFYSFLLSTAFIGVATVGQEKVEHLRAFAGWRGLRHLVLGVYGVTGYHVLYYLAFAIAPRSETNILNYLWPLLTVLFGMVAQPALFHWRAVLGALVGFAGAMLVISGGRGVVLYREYVVGYALVTAAAVVWASYSVWLGPRRLEPLSSNLVFSGATCLLAAGVVLALGTFRLPMVREWVGLIFMGAVPIAGGFLFWQEGLNRGDPALLGNLSFLIPFLSTFFLWALADVPIGPSALGGLVLVTFGAILGISRDR